MNAKKNYYTVLYTHNLREYQFSDPRVSQVFDEYVMINDCLEASDMEAAWVYMQGENWSSNGEARKFLGELGCFHTSMSVGDIFIDNNSLKAYKVAGEGFKELSWSKTQCVTLCDYLKDAYNTALEKSNV